MDNPDQQEIQDVVEKIWKNWRNVAPARMDAFLNPNNRDDHVGGIANYLWNQALSEALLPALHIFEVSIRNSIHSSLSHAYKT